jgi:hypothetical protein
MATRTLIDARLPEPISTVRSEGAALRLAALEEWLVKRGILFLLLFSPVSALFLGLMGLVPTSVGYLVLLCAFLVLPVWVAWRRSVSTDRTEPAFHLHRFMLYALFPYVVFSVVRIPIFYLFGLVYWGPWQTFGFGVTGYPVGFYPSLLSGAVLYSLQGIALAMGFYVLFARPTLINGLLYFFVFISSLYSFVFPVMLLRGSQPALPFHFTNYWAHFWMGLTAVLMPVLFLKVWPALRVGARTLLVAGLAVVWLTPYAFAFGQAQVWQFSTQKGLEQAAFKAITLDVASPATMTMSGDQARYSLDLRFGPREYVTYAHTHKAIGANDVAISGQLNYQGSPIAWCSGAVGALPGLANVRDPEKYFPALERINYTAIPVTCFGSAAAANGIAADLPLIFEYTAHMELTGERSTAPREFAGSVQTTFATS